MNFNDYSIDPYGAGQDGVGQTTVEDGGVTLHLAGNQWKKIDFAYDVTADTVLEFDFKSGVQGRGSGIGFDTDLGISSNLTFQLFGTQNWGLSAFYDYDTIGEYKHYQIPVGQYYMGSFSYLFFANDHDVSSPTGESYFSNIEIYEDVPTPNNQPPSVTTTSTTLDYTENDAATVVDAGVTVTDADDVTLASATVSITGNFAAGEDQLAFADTALLQGAVSGGGQTVTLTAQAGQSPTLADYQAALRSVTYVNLSDNPSTLLRTVTSPPMMARMSVQPRCAECSGRKRSSRCRIDLRIFALYRKHAGDVRGCCRDGGGP